MVKILKLKFRQDLFGEKIFCVGKKLAKLQMQILPELQLQNLDQALCSKSEQKFSLLAKPQRRNLQQIVANMILIKNSYNINKFWVGIFTRQGDINQVY